MTIEKICVSRNDAAIESHKKKLAEVLPRIQKLVDLYNELKLVEHSRSLPEIIKNAFMQCRQTVQAGLPPALKETNAVETILLAGEEYFFSLVAEMRRNGDLGMINSFTLKAGKVEINQDSLKKFEEENSIFLQDLRAKELLEMVVKAINDWEQYSQKNYRPGASLVLPAQDGGFQLNPQWRLAEKGKDGRLVLDLNLLAVFESGRL